MNKLKKSLYGSEEMLERFLREAEKISWGNSSDINFSQQEIKELLQRIQVQHIELEIQNDELKLSNKEAETQRLKFAELYDLAPVGYFILNGDGIITEVNATASNLLDRIKQDLLGRRFQHFVAPDDSALFDTFLINLFSSNTRRSCQLTLTTPKVASLYVQMEGIAAKNPISGKGECYITVIDLTERRKAELNLKGTKDRLEMALEASEAGTWQIDLQTQQISLDEFSCSIYGLPNCDSNQSIDRFVKMIHPDDRRTASKRFGEAINNKRDLDVEYRIIKPNGNISHISARGHLIESENSEQGFIGILMDITERKLLEEEALKLKTEHQKTILATVFRTQENERRRISEALHDSVSQLLYGIKLKLQDYKRLEKDNTIYDELHALIAQAVHETRDISFELAPSILTDFGLPIALEEMTKRLNSEKLKICTKISGLTKRLDINKEINIFRIIQELVNNVIKHAEATELKIELANKNNTLTALVSDNGKGFNSAGALKTSGSGLHSIKNRLDLFNGSMSIQSVNGGGTTVNILFKNLGGD